MRPLLISDTHGKLGIIDELSARTQADAVMDIDEKGIRLQSHVRQIPDQ